MTRDAEYLRVACERIRSDLEQIREAIRLNAGAAMWLDFDALWQLLSPYLTKSRYAGLLWFGLWATKRGNTISGGADSEKDGTSKPDIHIPSGARQELWHYCRRLVGEYQKLFESDEALKLQIDDESLQHLLGERRINDRQLRTFVSRVKNIDQALQLLDLVLTEFVEPEGPSQDLSENDKDYQSFVAQIETLRPKPERAPNNRNDALNLAQTLQIRRTTGKTAYLITSTPAVLRCGPQVARDPFFFALDAAVRSHVGNLSQDAQIYYIDTIIQRLTDVVKSLQEYAWLAPRLSKGNAQDVIEELGHIREALEALGSDPALQDISMLLATAHGLVRTAGAHIQESGMELRSKFETCLSRLRSHFGSFPRVHLRTLPTSAPYVSYSLLDERNKIHLAAEGTSEHLALAWPTELQLWEFLKSVEGFYRDEDGVSAQVLIRYAGNATPTVTECTELEHLTSQVLDLVEVTKAALVKIDTRDAVFWYDYGSLHAFDNPRQTLTPTQSKVAISADNTANLDRVSEFFDLSAIAPRGSVAETFRSFLPKHQSSQ